MMARPPFDPIMDGFGPGDDPDRPSTPRTAEIDTPEQWASRINWSVTTVADCYGIPDCKHQEGDWCLFDLNEDDPPIAVFPFREDADRVCQILRAAGCWPDRETEPYD